MKYRIIYYLFPEVDIIEAKNRKEAIKRAKFGAKKHSNIVKKYYVEKLSK